MVWIKMKTKIITLILITIICLSGCQNENHIQATSLPAYERPLITGEYTPIGVLTPTVKISTPAITATVQKELTPTEAILDTPLNGPFTLQYHFDGSVIIREKESGKIRFLPAIHISENDHFKRWSDDGCRLYAWTDSHVIAEIDLKGRVIQELYRHQDQEISGYEKTFEFGPSPDLKYASILTFSGNIVYSTMEFAYREIQDLFIRNLDTNEIQKISQNGGAYQFSWSPDGKRIAYMDFDENKNLRLYIAEVGGKKIEMDIYPVYQYPPQRISWSPNGNYIALAPAGDDHTPFYIINIEKNRIITVPLGYEEWSADGYLTFSASTTKTYFNPDDGKIIKIEEMPVVNLPEMNDEIAAQIVKGEISSSPLFPGEINCPNMAQ